MDWPTLEEAAFAAGLPAAIVDDPAWADAFDAGKAWCQRNAPRRFTTDGPDAEDSWYALCKAAALEFRGRGADYGLGYTETGAMTEPGGDGWQGVRRLLGLGFYAPPRAR